MHSQEREKLIFDALRRTGFVTYRELETALDASPATIRRDLARLESETRLQRVHGGAKSLDESAETTRLHGTPFAKSLSVNLAAKRAIGRAAVQLCEPGKGVIIDGGTTTFQMCDFLSGMELQVLTNSLHIVNALLPQEGTRLLLPSGSIFREQNIILAPGGDDSMPNFHAHRLFMGAAAVSPRGVFQTDAILVAGQRRFLDLADEIVLLADSSKLATSSGAIVCAIDRIDRLITDSNASDDQLEQLRRAGLKQIDIVNP